MTNALKTTIEKDGQRYLDEPVYVRVKTSAIPDALQASVSAAFNGGQPSADLFKKPVLVRHERVLLRWMTPDGKGGLKPRESR